MRIIVLCRGNSCRSQLTEAYLQLFLWNDAQVYSAGVLPKGVHPLTIRVLAEDNIDRSTKTSKDMSVFEKEQFDIILTVCDATYESCPIFSWNGKKMHHSFPDPDRSEVNEKDAFEIFRKLRDEIKMFCKELAEQIKQTHIE